MKLYPLDKKYKIIDNKKINLEGFLFFDQSIFEVIFWVVLIIAIFAVILFFVWFIRRTSRARSRYEKSTDDMEKAKINILPESTPTIDAVADMEKINISDSLSIIKDYYNIKTNPYSGEDNVPKKRVPKSQVKPHLDKILDYIVTKLNYFRENYGKELIEENYILETVLKFGTTSIELIIHYKAIAFTLKDIYPGDSVKKSEVDKLFLGAADLLNSKELQEVVRDNTKK